jgi:hypothetical protein
MSDKLIKYQDQILEAVKHSKSMAEAADLSGLSMSTFARYAKMLGVYKPNQAGKGLRKIKKKLIDVFEGREHMVTSHLKKRLISEGIKPNCCESCGISSWQGKPISLELDHIDGVRMNNSLDNLRILCPNCHSQTPTFRAHNKNRK